MAKLKNKIRNRKGFTLIELLVVLAVLAIIALIAVPKFTGIREQAKIDADARTLEMIEKALKLAVVSENKVVTETTNVLTVSTSGYTLNGVFTATELARYLDTTNVKLQASGATSVTFKLTNAGEITR